MNQSNSDWLAGWYRGQCNGEWEHSYGVSIETTDNPGWSLKIDLRGTPFEDVPFEKRESSIESEIDWLVCLTQDKTFRAYGGPSRLSEMIGVFKDWIEDHESRLIKKPCGT